MFGLLHPRAVAATPRFLAALILVVFAAMSQPSPATTPSDGKSVVSPGDAKSLASKDGAAGPDGDALIGAVVRLNAKAVPGARSLRTLGPEREGSGIVIGNDGLVLTIGYLIVEADEVTITDRKGKVRPARVVGYDHATGFGLVRTLAPFDATPIALGDSDALGEREPVMIVSSGGQEELSLAYVVSRRQFTGNWEYLLERAIFTSPPTMNWSGAALVGKDGKLLGVGSLILREVGRDLQLPGNMFVPIDLLKPILSDLVKDGRRAGPARPWLGLSADEVQGRLFVSRVSPDSPADKAGLQPGDIIIAVGNDAVKTQADFYRRIWGQGAAGVEVPLKVLQGAELKEVKIRSIDRVEYFKAKATF